MRVCVRRRDLLFPLMYKWKIILFFYSVIINYNYWLFVRSISDESFVLKENNDSLDSGCLPDIIHDSSVILGVALRF